MAPTAPNCPHLFSGWCPDCVGNVQADLEMLRAAVAEWAAADRAPGARQLGHKAELRLAAATDRLRTLAGPPANGEGTKP